MKKIILVLMLNFCLAQTHFAQTNLWGMTSAGGTANSGVIFKANPDGTNSQVVYSFPSSPNQGGPQGSLISYGNKLYGMTFAEGALGYGSLCEFDPLTNNLITKIDFNSTSNGAFPFSLMSYGTKLYGMTWAGGSNGTGTLFEYDPATGSLVKKIDFIGSNGAQPYGILCASGNKLLGMTQQGGINNQGILFEFDPITGLLTKKIDFNGALNGSRPRGSLCSFGSKFYGMTTEGGVNNTGTLFEYDPATGSLTKKIDFNNSTIGGSPFGSLTVFGSKLYGITSAGGLNNYGTIIEFDPSNLVLAKRFDFNGTTGGVSYGTLTVSGTKLYGMTQNGGSNLGALFEFDPINGPVSVKNNFNGLNGSHPVFTQLLLYTPSTEINIKQTNSIASGSTFDFGNITIPNSSGAITFTIENLGISDLNLSTTPKVIISGANASDFFINESSTQSTIAPGGNTSFTVNFTPSSLGLRIASISIANNDSNENPYIINLTGTGVCPTPVSAGPITGLPSVCSGALNQSYSVVNNAGSSYSWTVPSGATIVSGQGTSAINVNFGSLPGNVAVVETKATGCIGSPSSLAIAINPLPNNSLIISGPFLTCAGKTNNIYSVTNAIAGASYNWTVGGGSTIVSGQGTSSINVTWGTAAGQVTVSETNSCGTGALAYYNVTLNASPNNALTVTGPASVCASKTGNVFTVTNPAAGATYTWTVPTGASIVSGQNTPTLTVNWGTTAGSVTVKEVNSCGTGTAVAKAVTISAPYALGNIDAFCGSSFCLPLKTTAAISNGIIGIDFAINYNSSVVTPTGTAFLGSVATSYGSYFLNTTTPGKIYVSVALDNAPNGTYFKGTGDIICVSFNVNPGAAIGTAFTLSTDGIEESTPVSTNVNCQVVPLAITVKGALAGTLIYRNSPSVTLNYDASNPGAYVATNITGVNASCTAPSTAVSKPDLSGNFKYNSSNGVNLKIQRDISGDLNVPVLNCTNVQSVINSVDRNKAWEIATYKNSAPTIYELLSSDVNLDGKVTAGDVSLISSRSINGNNCEFPQSNYTWNGTALVIVSPYAKSQDWLFVNDATLATAAFTSGASRNAVPKVPVCMPAPTGTASCTPVSSATYHAILLGDVDGNWTSANGATMRMASTDALILDLNHLSTNVQGNFVVPVYYQNKGAYSGMDFSIDYGNNISILNVSSNSSLSTIGTEFNNFENQRLMVTSYTEVPVSTSAPVSYIEISSSNNKISPSDFNNSQAYLNGQPVAMKFAFDNAVSQNHASVEVFPNPFGKETYIYAKDEADFVSVVVFSINGEIVYENNQVPSNENFKLDSITEPGVYFIKITCSSGTVTKKLVKI